MIALSPALSVMLFALERVGGRRTMVGLLYVLLDFGRCDKDANGRGRCVKLIVKSEVKRSRSLFVHKEKGSMTTTRKGDFLDDLMYYRRKMLFLK